MEAADCPSQEERRQHRRLAIRLPLQLQIGEAPREHTHRTVTTNISTGGLFFELELADGVEAPLPRSALNIELTVPPGEGHFPYHGKLSSTAQVLRCDPLTNGHPPAPGAPRRIGVAAQFCDALKLEF